MGPQHPRPLSMLHNGQKTESGAGGGGSTLTGVSPGSGQRAEGARRSPSQRHRASASPLSGRTTLDAGGDAGRRGGHRGAGLRPGLGRSPPASLTRSRPRSWL